ncbi:MAG: hypothetical protein K0R43_516 [Pseudoduganella sp.]|jgi:hypothetical protein|nr:hypothetical protein [Pseudoduganella sp.]
MGRFLLLLVIWCSTMVELHAAEYRVAPTPGWVEPLPVNLALKPASGQSSGEWNILSDVQIRIEKGNRSSYFHFANKALDANGVHEIADLSFVIDPSYEQLTLHMIRVLRDGQVIDKLAGAKIKVLQRETELEYRIYDGSKTVSVVMDDVRAGDVVEYAYSRRGINPVFGNRVAGGTDLQWGVPVGQAALRLLVPDGRTLAIQMKNGAPQPQVREAAGYREYRWSRQDVPRIKVERGAPASYYPYAHVRWSEFADWKAVVDWGMPLYRESGELGSALEAVIERIRRAEPTLSGRLRAVLHLVQSDIRYLGVEVGAGSYAPSMPATVFQRRFGDCKDKARLVVAMLRRLGIHAAPALVNTDRRETVADNLPAPNVFNHVVVRATLDGKHYWLDPTTAPQGGDLDSLVQSDHGLALVLDEGETGLSKMAGRDGRNRKQVKAVFDGREGDGKPMRYTITTVAYGVEADHVRAQFARRGLAEMQSQYVNYYARRYPEIKVAAPLTHLDDAKRNEFTTVESYEIPDFWNRPEPGKRRQGYIRSSELRTQLAAPDDLNRTAPLATRYPEDIEEITEVRLSGDWEVKPENFALKDAAFEFSHKVERGEGDVKYVLTGRLRWLKAQVDPAEVREYAANLKKAHDEIGLILYMADSPATPVKKVKPLNAGIDPVAAATRAEQDAQRMQLLVLVIFWSLLALVCWRSPAAHRPLNWYLMWQVVWISAALWILLARSPNSWKTQSLALIVVYFGSIALQGRADRAPETHWQHAHINPEVLASKAAGVRYLVRGLQALPTLALWIGVGYYIKALMT